MEYIYIYIHVYVYVYVIISYVYMNICHVYYIYIYIDMVLSENGMYPRSFDRENANSPAFLSGLGVPGDGVLVVPIIDNKAG